MPQKPADFLTGSDDLLLVGLILYATYLVPAFVTVFTLVFVFCRLFGSSNGGGGGCLCRERETSVYPLDLRPPPPDESPDHGAIDNASQRLFKLTTKWEGSHGRLDDTLDTGISISFTSLTLPASVHPSSAVRHHSSVIITDL